MKHRTAPRLSTLLALALLAGCAAPQRDAPTATPAAPAPTATPAPAGLPTGDQVLERYIEVTGGRAAYEQIRDRQASGKLEIPTMAMDGPVEIWQTADKGYIEADVEGLGLVQSGFSDGVVWELNLLSGPRLLEGPERAFTLRSMTLHAELRWRDYFDSAECVGTEQLGERQAYKVVLQPKVGLPVTSFYDVESGLLLRTDMIIQSQMGEVPSVTTVEDYREVDGILIPHVTRQKIMEIDQVMTLDSIRQNIRIPDDRFALPQEIQELVDQGAPAPGPGAGTVKAKG